MKFERGFRFFEKDQLKKGQIHLTPDKECDPVTSGISIGLTGFSGGYAGAKTAHPKPQNRVVVRKTNVNIEPDKQCDPVTSAVSIGLTGFSGGYLGATTGNLPSNNSIVVVKVDEKHKTPKPQINPTNEQSTSQDVVEPNKKTTSQDVSEPKEIRLSDLRKNGFSDQEIVDNLSQKELLYFYPDLYEKNYGVDLNDEKKVKQNSQQLQAGESSKIDRKKEAANLANKMLNRKEKEPAMQK